MFIFNISNMNCGHCVASITQAIHDMDANAQVNINLSQKEVQVETQANSGKLGQVLAKAGYAATLIS